MQLDGHPKNVGIGDGAGFEPHLRLVRLPPVMTTASPDASALELATRRYRVTTQTSTLVI